MENKALGIRVKGKLAFESMIFSYRKRQEGLKLREIGELLNISPAAVSTKLKSYSDLMETDPGFKVINENYKEKQFLKDFKVFKTLKSKVDERNRIRRLKGLL